MNLHALLLCWLGWGGNQVKQFVIWFYALTRDIMFSGNETRCLEEFVLSS